MRRNEAKIVDRRKDHVWVVHRSARTIQKHEGYTSGSLWSFHPLLRSDQLINQALPEIGLSKGIVFDHHRSSQLYYIDAANQRILSFAYDKENRRVTRFTRVLFDLNEWHRNLQHPLYSRHVTLGAMTLDTRYQLWVPLIGGSHVLEIDPTIYNGVVRFIYINAVKLNACLFGGVELNILYVSSMPCGSNEECPSHDEGGKIFAVSNLGDGVKGNRSPRFDMPPDPPPKLFARNHYWA
ncbi:uncharacterized protein LOC117176364 [Belonocnema kinseyi]|uniref:uncharacterized protein LOC117176364 n=1 Tax=Belonocnema kinseyi TaxID=2817044 RepID=UPI00143D4273|nr:uncharacterized protein LOC117176364 [Belonocnema kinseyi]